jgi:hypothetical protein
MHDPSIMLGAIVIIAPSSGRLATRLSGVIHSSRLAPSDPQRARGYANAEKAPGK